MKEISTYAQAEFDVVCKEWDAHLEQIRRTWRDQNQMINVFEVMSTEEKKEVQRRLEEWSRSITPIAEEWWKSRGYEVIWPADNTQPMTFRKIATSDCKNLAARE